MSNPASFDRGGESRNCRTSSVLARLVFSASVGRSFFYFLGSPKIIPYRKAHVQEGFFLVGAPCNDGWTEGHRPLNANRPPLLHETQSEAAGSFFYFLIPRPLMGPRRPVLQPLPNPVLPRLPCSSHLLHHHHHISPER